ncbi:MAG: 2-oxoacid:ferredoxin oxidoreductase subunit beta [Candidatus Thiodiazotropha sp. (ex Lucinoma annulata)]|nr:2-oxoacid:ferredoxin oxidoreductase subunit beta [Candidatus Thiodiazotropha sp. (ex Lucinoma borealis)]MCU7841376.1 2-oxoacid:ferredoxin oxidoreductase subunit beta [Candidatus Thiodiazotropha sp. (ex Troendleina suluensis)]MCU7885801.1 2-oxoacid:ferredoxin oxidoreductase subunit beta [Candidatus Thiodiazotropha sp. (ex Lucinoma annulata)]MCU7947768.1 2-oxoacid:ferredoxin oxidoreductase subunit beta [Candidatus Thiodiazotropha sp. (ex Cardiolucina cf. quadrata)]MCU7854582.1 2-oxoacid:ferred
MPVPALKAKDYKSDIKPVWCPGCGHFAVLSALTKAMAHLGLVKEKVAVVSGIGCSSRLPAYIDSYGFHGIHGRALAAASGLKAARPDLTVVVAGGDGDGFSIGGNHFLHACRRNMDITYIVMDNEVYGMTKGQASPTTRPTWSNSEMTPHGTGIPCFNPAAIALAAGAGFIARGYSGEPSEMTRLLVEAIEYPGFAFVQVLSGCVTFRPDQRSWKEEVHPFINDVPTEDRIKAAQIIQADDGMATGVIYASQYPVWQPDNQKETELSLLEQEFDL